MKKRNKKITFVFQTGRKKKLKSNEKFAKDMFYTYFNFSEEFETEIIEFRNFKHTPINKFFLIFEREVIRRFFKIPAYWVFLTSKENFLKLKSSDAIILSTNRVASSVLPMLLLIKLIKRKVNVTFFVLGLYASLPKFKIFRIFQSFYYFLLFSVANNILFIGEGEYEHAIKKNKWFKKKFHYAPFGIDLSFWKNNKNDIEFENKKGILFVGNDSNRSFETVIQLSRQLKEYEFTFVTNEIFEEDVGSNVTLHNGSWGSPALSDSELKELYQKSKLTIIPLKDTIQPSGQSVALQSMAAGTPVLITDIEGLWDKRNLINNENIVLLNSNDIEEWKSKILKLYPDSNKLSNISKNGVECVTKNFDMDNFYKQIKDNIPNL